MINVLGTNTVCFWRLTTSGLQSAPAGLTINSGTAGQNGPTLVTFSSGGQPKFPTGGCVVVPNVEVIYQILNPGSNRYVNLLTNDYASGAARGQVRGGARCWQSLRGRGSHAHALRTCFVSRWGIDLVNLVIKSPVL